MGQDETYEIPSEPIDVLKASLMLAQTVQYWKTRCLLSEKINECNEMTTGMFNARKAYNKFIEENKEP